MTATARARLVRAFAPQAIGRLAAGRTARVMAVRCLGLSALFGFEVILARSLGINGYGTLSFALVVAGLVSRLAPLGWLNITTRLVSAYARLMEFGLLKGSLVLAHLAVVLGLGIASVVLVAALPGSVPGGGVTLTIVLATGVALALLELHRHVLRGLHAGDLGEALVILLLPAIAAAVVYILAIRDFATAGYAYAAVGFGLVALSGIAIAHRLPAEAWSSRAQFRVRDWSLAALALLLGGASSEILTRTSVILLGVLGEQDDVGLYHAAARLALLNVFVLRALTPVAAPQFSELYSAGLHAELRALFRRQCILSFAGALPIFLVLSLYPRIVLDFFGAEFVAGEWLLRVLSIGYLASAATGPCGTALMMIGRERAYACITGTALVVGVAANAVLIHHMGALGAALASAAVLVFNNSLYLAAFLWATRQGPAGATARNPT
ncbi:MAG: polysaccharide biosynthesis C-terminal domain-containing protein [Bacteroidota bacterium]